MRILYTGTYNSVLSFLVWNVIIYTYHNTRLYVAQYIAVQLYLFTFHLHKRCIIIILVEELDLLVHVLFCGALYQFHHHLS